MRLLRLFSENGLPDFFNTSPRFQKLKSVLLSYRAVAGVVSG
jgi:hypothetical protein